MTHENDLAGLTGPGGPYEMAEIDTDRGPIRVFVTAPQTLRLLYENAISDATFLVDGDCRLTFREAHARSAALAHGLVHDHGVRPGDRVAISMRNRHEWMLSFAAATSVGAIAVAMNSLWTPEEMAFALQDSDARILVADDERIRRAFASGALGRADVVGVGADPSEFPAGMMRPIDEIWSRHEGAPMPEWSGDAADAATILYTSGSTGNPKGVLSTHRNIISALMTWELESRRQSLRAQIAAGPESIPTNTPAPVALLAVPLFHVLGLHSVFLSSYRSQRTLVTMRRWDPVAAAEIIERESVTSFSAPPTMTGDLVREAEKSGRNLDSLMTVGGGGAARAPEQVSRIDATFPVAAPSTGWGMTETAAAGTTISGADYLARPTSTGRTLAVVDARVVDDQGRECGVNEPGELQVRGSVVFREYWKRPDATAEVFTADGWLCTGDVARIDDEGYVYIVDRLKDLIIRGGENIGCGHVEGALLSHPLVLEAAVYGIPDERLGETVAATVHTNGAVDLDELTQFLREHLAEHEIPTFIVVSDEPLERTGSGKILKRSLREQAIALATGR